MVAESLLALVKRDMESSEIGHSRDELIFARAEFIQRETNIQDREKPLLCMPKKSQAAYLYS